MIECIFGINTNGTPVKAKRTYRALRGSIDYYDRIAKLARMKKLNWMKSNKHKVHLLIFNA